MTTRDRIVLMVAGVLVVVGAFWMLALSPRRHQASDLAAKISDERSQIATLSQHATHSTSGRHAEAADAKELALLGKAVPADDQMASLMYQLQDAAGRSHVAFSSITPSGQNGAPAGNAAAPAPVPTVTTPSSSTSTTPAPAPSSGSTPAAPGSTPAAPGATPASNGIQQLSLALIFDGPYADLERFLARVHGFTTISGNTLRVRGRLLSIDGVALTAGPNGFPQIRATISATAYISPTALAGTGTGAAGSAAPAAATASATTPAAPPAASGSSAPTAPAMVGTP